MIVTIENFEIYTTIGILETEQTATQKIILELEIDYEFDQDYFLDYADVMQEIKKLFATSRFGLLEDGAIAICARLKHRFERINNIQISIKKPEILAPAVVGIKFTKKFSETLK